MGTNWLVSKVPTKSEVLGADSNVTLGFDGIAPVDSMQPAKTMKMASQTLLFNFDDVYCL